MLPGHLSESQIIIFLWKILSWVWQWRNEVTMGQSVTDLDQLLFDGVKNNATMNLETKMQKNKRNDSRQKLSYFRAYSIPRLPCWSRITLWLLISLETTKKSKECDLHRFLRKENLNLLTTHSVSCTFMWVYTVPFIQFPKSVNALSLRHWCQSATHFEMSSGKPCSQLTTMPRMTTTTLPRSPWPSRGSLISLKM